MEEFIRQHLEAYDKNTQEIDNITEILRNRFSEATDEEKIEIIEIINSFNKKELSNHSKLQEIRDWLNKRTN